MPVVSVIVPVFNARNYIRKTIESILLQSYTDYELILVVDGAYDGSYEICKEYELKDHRIQVYYQTNKGCSIARNVGLEKATGRYVLFVDHDDELDKGLLECIVNEALHSGTDVIKFGANIIDIGSDGHTSIRIQKYDSLKASEEQINAIYKSIIRQGMNIYVWDSLFKKEFLLSNNIYFDDRFKSGGEDICFNIKVFSAVKNFMAVENVLYNHYNRSNQSTSLQRFDGYFEMKAEIVQMFSGATNDSEIYTLFVAKSIGSVFYKAAIMKLDPQKLKENMEVYYSGIDWEKINMCFESLSDLWMNIKLLLFKMKKYRLLAFLYMRTLDYKHS